MHSVCVEVQGPRSNVRQTIGSDTHGRGADGPRIMLQAAAVQVQVPEGRAVELQGVRDRDI